MNIDKELSKFYESLKLALTLITILIPIILFLGNISIGIESISNLASNNNFGSNINCNAANTISEYYSCQLNITEHSYMPQYKTLALNITFIIMLIALVFSILMLSQHVNTKKRSLLLTFAGFFILILWSITMSRIEVYTLPMGTAIVISLANITFMWLFVFMTIYIIIMAITPLRSLLFNKTGKRS